MKIKRRFTTVEGGPYAKIEFHTVTSEIRNPDGSTVFKNDSVEVPTTWSQVASDIIAQKYFRKAGLPVKSKPVEEADVPNWLWRQETDTDHSGAWSGPWNLRTLHYRLRLNAEGQLEV